MNNWSWTTATGADLLMVFISGFGIYIALILLTRMVGLRSFSKLSSFDFAITIAFGSIIATTILSKDTSLATGAFGLAVLYGIKYAVSSARIYTKVIERLVDNNPILIMAGEKVLSDHLKMARMTEEDLKSKLREAGVTSRKQVLAVVFETTGDVSVLKKCDEVDPWLFSDIRGADELSLRHVRHNES